MRSRRRREALATGTIVLDEQIFVITEVKVREGAFEVRALRKHPARIPAGTSEYRVHSSDGQVVFVSKHTSSDEITTPHPGDTIELTVRCNVANQTADQ